MSKVINHLIFQKNKKNDRFVKKKKKDDRF